MDKDFRELAKQIVDGDVDINPDIMDYISERLFDEDSQIDAITMVLEEFGITTAEDFEEEFMEQLEEGSGPMLALIGTN